MTTTKLLPFIRVGMSVDVEINLVLIKEVINSAESLPVRNAVSAVLGDIAAV